ncbi:MAG: hypothetical protein IRZ00_02055 [Gemmatimonadetes bacterium]|nr:hypothetical protein [Gemmatimonadota bacterium]
MRIPDTPTRLATKRLDTIQAEIAQEKAAALARIGGRLEEALARLAAADAAPAPPDPAERDRLLAAAGEALWYYVVQREACGLRGDLERVLRELGVSPEVHRRMGYYAPAAGSAGAGTAPSPCAEARASTASRGAGSGRKPGRA